MKIWFWSSTSLRTFLLLEQSLEICWDWSAMLGDYLSQKLSLPPPSDPKMLPKMWLRGPKISQNLSMPIFLLGLNGQNRENAKDRFKNLFPSAAVWSCNSCACAAQFPHCNSEPVYKCLKSKEPRRSVVQSPFWEIQNSRADKEGGCCGRSDKLSIR